MTRIEQRAPAATSACQINEFSVSNVWHDSLFAGDEESLMSHWWGVIRVTFMNEPPVCLYNKRYTKKEWAISHKHYTKKMGERKHLQRPAFVINGSQGHEPLRFCTCSSIYHMTHSLLICLLYVCAVTQRHSETHSYTVSLSDSETHSYTVSLSDSETHLYTPSYMTWLMTCWFICCMLRSHVWHALDTRAGAVSHRFAGSHLIYLLYVDSTCVPFLRDTNRCGFAPVESHVMWLLTYWLTNCI